MSSVADLTQVAPRLRMISRDDGSIDAAQVRVIGLDGNPGSRRAQLAANPGARAHRFSADPRPICGTRGCHRARRRRLSRTPCKGRGWK